MIAHQMQVVKQEFIITIVALVIGITDDITELKSCSVREREAV